MTSELFTPEQQARNELRAVARELVRDRCPLRHVRELMAQPAAFDSQLWRAMSTAGWLALEVPESLGGGGSFEDVAVVLEELGRGVVPGPYFSTAVFGVGAIMAAGSASLREQLLPAVADGACRIAFAPGDALDDDGSADGVRADRAADGIVLHGVIRFVPDAHLADWLIAVAVGEDGPYVALVNTAEAGVTVEVTPTFDQTRRLCTVTLDGCRAAGDSLLATGSAASALIAYLLQRGAAALACDAVGGAEQAMDLAVAYAKVRRQFGRQIGSFQAVKHHCANMAVRVRNSRIAVDAAARDISSLKVGDLSRWAHIAKAYATEAYVQVAGDAVQVHGGIGFTWEHDIHLYLKRSKLDEALFGTPAWHRNVLGRALMEDAVVLSGSSSA
jgi:alkylation response protein AidB-like acyl-CoA dehydrogenase